MTITISDGLNVVDISEATVHKVRTPRIAALSPPNTIADIIQTFGSEGFSLSIEGDWVTAPGQLYGTTSRPDYRGIMEAWRRSNVLVQYQDGQLSSWFAIRSFVSHLTPGQPGAAGLSSTVIHYSIELTESLRIREIGDLEELPITIGNIDLPVEGTFSTWTQSWTVLDPDTITGANFWIDEINLQLWIVASGFVKARSLTTGAITFVKNTNIGDSPQGPFPTNDTQTATIQKQYVVVFGKPGGPADAKIFSVMKNGLTLFTPAADVSTNNLSVLLISITGKYICTVDTANNIFLWSG